MKKEELILYSRHIMLPEIDMDGQIKLLNSRVSIIGLGGLGSSCSIYLAASGIGNLSLIDDDLIELSNLQRQIIFTLDDIGKKKSSVAKKRLTKLQAILERNNSIYKEGFLGKSTEVLFENKLDNQNKYFGRDKFLNSVIVYSEKNLTGKILDIKINAFNHNNLFGDILSNEKRNFAA